MSRQILDNNGFVEAGNISLSVVYPIITFKPEFLRYGKNDSLEGWIYAWVLLNTNKFQIVYIGMTTRTIRYRSGQHQGSWAGKSSAKGQLNGEMLTEALNNGDKVQIFARKAARAIVLGEDVCMSSVEEQAMIKKCRSNGITLWNF